MPSGWRGRWQILWAEPVLTLKNDDWRRVDRVMPTGRGAPQAIVTAFAPVLFAILEASVAGAAGNVRGQLLAGHATGPT